MRTCSPNPSASAAAARSDSPSSRLRALSPAALASSPAFFACPTWRESSFTSARIASALASFDRCATSA